MSTVGPIGHIKHSLDLAGLTDDTTEPTSAMQYAVSTPTGRVVFGDQEWVRSGQALAELPDGAKVQRRTITISYGEWEDV